MSEVSEVSEVCPTEPSTDILSCSEEAPRAIQRDFSRARHTSDTSNTWESEVSEVSWLVLFRYFRHFKPPDV